MSESPESVINFWFNELTPKQHWQVDSELDSKISKRFSNLIQKAACGELFNWRQTPVGRLAEIIVLDQFSRNVYRGTPNAFAQDPIALVLAQEAVSLSVPDKLSNSERSFLYMPYMHSESKSIHEVALVLFQQPQVKNNLDFETRHKAIIDRFDRYPHRNQILGRQSTPEEIEFLQQPGSAF